MGDPRISALLCEMADPASRARAAQALAQALGAEALLAFVPDEEVGELLPAPGFPQSIAGGAGWRSLLRLDQPAGIHRASVAFPLASTLRPAAALTLADHGTFVLIGAEAQVELLDQPALALLSALMRAEIRLIAADAKAGAARETALRANTLMAAVDAARAVAEEATGAKNQFLAMLGHELRNPLSPIVSALQLLKLRGDFQSHSELLVIERQVEHLITLVNDLMDVARITRGKVSLKLEDLELGEVVQRAVEMAQPLIDGRNHKLELEVPDSGLRVRGDRMRLKQVIVNLLTNAAKYTPPGGLVRVRAARDVNEITLTVTDTGVGISKAFLPRVFDLFVQHERSSDRAEGGLGIGLALVRNLVRLHGGSVSAHSEGTGRGSTFTLRFPALPLAGTTRTEPSATLAPIPWRGARRIIVVDDNADAAKMLALSLRTAGHDVVVAHDGPAALHRADSFRPEIAILDIGLPQMDGYELARRFRTRPQPPALMALTGYAQPEDRARSSAAGFEHHWVKPVEIARLLEAINLIPRRDAATPLPA